MADTLLKVRHLKKYFKTPKGMLHAVDDINFDIERGQTLGVVGESGCGKSTLGRTILHLLEPTEGEITFDGADISKMDAVAFKESRKQMQIIFQDPYSSLNPRMTVEDIITEPLIIFNVFSNAAERKQHVQKLMDSVGLASRLARSYPHELDGGRRQRIGVARALALQPKFIVCDEPVSALDVSIQAQILNLMQDLQEEMGLTYLFITHDLSVVKHISNEICVMYLGKIDTYTVELKTFGPFGPILDYLSNTSVGYIVNKQAYEEQSPEDYARNPTGGTGPYRFVEWIAGDRVVYERNEDYWGDKPYFKNLVIRNIADDVTRALSLESGEVDVIYGVDTASYETLLNAPTTNLISFPSYQLIHMGLNNTLKPFDDVRVRKALWYALDIDSMVRLAFSGQAEVADACWPNSLPVYKPAEGEEAHVYDVEKAKALLKEAGYEDGFSFDLWVAETTAWVQMAEMIQNALSEIGVTAKVQIMDQNTLLTKRTEGTYQAYIARFSASSADADWWYNRLYSEGTWQENVVQYINADVDEWLTTARYSLDSEVRDACYFNILHQWRMDLPWISLSCPQMTYGIRSTLDGMEPHGYGIGDLRYIHPISAE